MFRTLVTSLLLGPFAAGLLLVANAAADGPGPIDITGYTDDLVVLTDGSDHFVILEPFSKRRPKPFFYGTGKVFHLQRSAGGSSRGRTRFSVAFWEPRWNPKFHRNMGVHGRIEFKDEKYRVRCDDRWTDLIVVKGDKRRLLLGTGKFYEELWQRRTYALARDDEGTYFFVDRSRAPDSRDFRVFKGPRGNMKLLEMKNIVYDSAGAIFTTNLGQLRLVLGEKDARWVEGKTKTELIYLPLADNRYLIYAELGVYQGALLGTPCDHL